MFNRAHFIKYKLLYLNVAIWTIASAVGGNLIALVVSTIGFLLIVRKANPGEIIMSLLIMLIFSDSRSSLFQFAAQAKVGITLISAWFVVSRWNQIPQNSNRILSYFLPFLAYAFLLIPAANDIFGAFQKTLSYSLIFLIVPSLFAAALKNDKDFQNDFLVFLFTVLIAGILIRLFNPGFVTLASRYRGLLGNPNGLGIFLTLIFPLAYIIIRSNGSGQDRRQKWLFFGALAVSLLLCQSRTALLACTLFLIFNAYSVLRGFIGFLLFLIIIFSYEYLLSEIPLIIIALDLGEYFRIDSLMEGSGRLVAWEFAWEKLQDVFFFGGGFDYTNDLFMENYTYLSRLGHQGNAHNSFLTLWLDTGIIGLVLFSLGLFRLVFYSMQKSSYTLPVLYAILFSTNFESWLAASLNPFTSVFLITFTILTNPDLINKTLA